MTMFCYKKISSPTLLGQKFAQAREELKFDLKKVSELSQISTKYLIALENNNFKILPTAKAHRLAYVREYARIVNLSPESCWEQFIAEGGMKNSDNEHPRTTIKRMPFTSISIFLRNSVLVGGVLVFVIYMVTQIAGIMRPPDLSIFAPAEGFVLNLPSTTLQGQTEKETKLTVNGQDVMVDEEGKFQLKMDLSEGVNTITVEAIKKHGKSSLITRHVVVKKAFKAEQVSLK